MVTHVQTVTTVDGQNFGYQSSKFKVQNGLFNQKSSLGVQTTNQQEKNNLKTISISFDNS